MTETILLVDDSADDAYLTVHAFRQCNITNDIVLAADGVEALELLLPAEGTGIEPAVILLDINMPRMGGLELLSRLRQDARTRSVPVIMLTTSSEEQDIAASYASGGNSYITKPVTAAEFVEVARMLGLYWLGLNTQARPILLKTW